MDLSWCIICDRHCIEDNLYCSDSCRVQDVNTNKVTSTTTPNFINSTPFSSPPSSPLLDPFFSSFNHHDRRTSITISRSTTRSNSVDYFGYSSVPRYSLSD